MRRIIGVVMAFDGLMQAMGVAGVLTTFADRNLGDQSLVVAHVVVGPALLFAGRRLYSGRALNAGRVLDVGRADLEARLTGLALAAALLLSLIETTWFNWINLVARAVYTAAALAVLLRKTSLPTT